MVEKDQETGKDFFAGTFLEGLEYITAVDDGKTLSRVGRNEKVVGEMLPCEKALWGLRGSCAYRAGELDAEVKGKGDALTLGESNKINQKISALLKEAKIVNGLVWDMMILRIGFDDMPESAMGIREGFKIVVFDREEDGRDRIGDFIRRAIESFHSSPE